MELFALIAGGVLILGTVGALWWNRKHILPPTDPPNMNEKKNSSIHGT